MTDLNGHLIACAQIDSSQIRDNCFHPVLDLRGMALTVGKSYTVRLSAPEILGASDDQYVSAWVLPLQPQYAELTRHIVSFRRDRQFTPTKERHFVAGAAVKCVIAVASNPAPSDIRNAIALASAAFPQQQFELVEMDTPSSYWPHLAGADAVIFAGTSPDPDPEVGFDAICFALHRHGICTIFLPTSNYPERTDEPNVSYVGRLSRVVSAQHDIQRRCHFYLRTQPSLTLYDSITEDPLTPATPNEAASGLLSELVERVRTNRRPHVAVISVLHSKADAVNAFLDHIVKQTYDGKISVVLVDDASPDDDLARAEAYSQRLHAVGLTNRRILTFQNERNLGNCASRLAGLAACPADIYVIVDCDCLLNSRFVAAHVFEHACPGVDAVVGPLNIESNGRNPSELVAELEYFPDRIAARAEPQDPIQADGFLNTITRNFSIKHCALPSDPLFDTDFSYSKAPGSGFGWEDVEMGYRLYQRAAVIRFTPEAFSVHCTHPSSISEADKLAGSMRNFERLFIKHPEMALVARRWALDTYDKFCSWSKALNAEDGDAKRRLDAMFQSPLQQRRDLVSLYRNRQTRPLRILSYRWHVAHQYELYKLPHVFTLATGWENGMFNHWSYDQRPLRSNVGFMPHAYIDPRQFDLAILHFDENVLNSAHCNGIIPANWGEAFRWLLALPGLPKIAVCHGTPQFVGQYALDPAPKTTFEIYENERRRLVEALTTAGAYVVCNSHQALREWQFSRSRVIWHGFDPQQFPQATYVKDVLALQPDIDRPHYRGAWEHLDVERKLAPGIKIETANHPGVAIEPRHSNAFAVPNFRCYVDRIRQFTAYLNTTLRSPMPRARGEAMMTGVTPVCLNNHDVDMFLEPGINGFFSNDTSELADFINFLCRDREAAKRIGLNARQTALDLFNHDRFLSAWTKLINEVLN